MKYNTQTWNKEANALLAGQTITAVKYMTDEDAENFGWRERGLFIGLSNGAYLLVQQDDEGNGPGALYLMDKNGYDTTLPTLPTNWSADNDED
tara:strand:- start:584 stop:862 length:279 start_codon:yes stop_codon:yes gene_type:complete